MKKSTLSKIAYEKQTEKFFKMADSQIEVGKNYFEELAQVSKYYVSVFGNGDNSPKLVGILDANDITKKESYKYYTIKLNDNQFVSPVYLIKREPSYFNSGNIPLITKWLEAHPFALYFCGSDDGSIAKVFKTEKAAMDFLKTNPNFYDLLENHKTKMEDVIYLYKNYPNDNYDSMLDEMVYYIN